MVEYIVDQGIGVKVGNLISLDWIKIYEYLFVKTFFKLGNWYVGVAWVDLNKSNNWHPKFRGKLEYLQEHYDQLFKKEFDISEINIAKQYVDEFMIKMDKLLVFA